MSAFIWSSTHDAFLLALPLLLLSAGHFVCALGEDGNMPDVMDGWVSGDDDTRCWGFEPSCHIQSSYSNEHIRCRDGSTTQWVFRLTHCPPYHPWSSLSTIDSIDEQRELFWRQGDFGYLRNTFSSMLTLCDDRG